MTLNKNFNDFKNVYDDIHQKYWSDNLQEKDLEKWHDERLKIVLNHVKKTSPFYQKHLQNIDISSVNSKNLSTLPFTTKEDLRDNMQDIICNNLSEAIFYYETTGTTGPATPCPRDKKESYASNKQLAMAWKSVMEKHFPDKKPIVGIAGPTEVHSFGDTIGDVCYQLDICNAKLWPHSPVIGFPKSLQLLKTLGINVVASAPGLLLALAKEAEKHGYNSRKDFDINIFMMSGELCTPALKNNLYSLWNAEAYNSLYGSQEALIISATNSEDQLVPHRLNYIIEILDPKTGKNLDLTSQGELCVTMLIDGVKPLIRYRTGDLVQINLSGKKEISQKYLMKIVGRVKDQLMLNDKAFSAGYIEQCLMQDIENCLGYQIIINNNGKKDTIIAQLEMSKFFDKDKAKLCKMAKDRISSQLDIESTVMVVDDLDDHVNLGSWFSWKEARIIDQRTKAAPAL